MFAIAKSRGSGTALMLVGVAFVVMGIGRRQHGGSSAFMVIGLVLIVVGLRRIRRIARAPGLGD